ncbi:MAG TPA: STAS domain-containing protein [Kineosporiaceae bacterium]
MSRRSSGGKGASATRQAAGQASRRAATRPPQQPAQPPAGQPPAVPPPAVPQQPAQPPAGQPPVRHLSAQHLPVQALPVQQQLQQQREPRRRILELEGELTIHTAAEHRGRLLGAIEGDAELALDLTAVTELDTAGLQLLLLAQREAEHVGGRFTLAGASRSVTDVLAIAHLDSTLGHLGGLTGAEARR